jgi:hypothetical protein
MEIEMLKHRSSSWSNARLVVCVLLGMVPLGCGGPSSTLPPSYSVTGSVHYKSGGPVAGGAIQFTSVSDTSFSVSGDISDDGKFTLYTVKGNERVHGVPEGEYTVTVQPPIPADQHVIPPIVLPKTYRVEPKDNEFTLEVTASSKKP